MEKCDICGICSDDDYDMDFFGAGQSTFCERHIEKNKR